MANTQIQTPGCEINRTGEGLVRDGDLRKSELAVNAIEDNLLGIDFIYGHWPRQRKSYSATFSLIRLPNNSDMFVMFPLS